MNEAQALPNHPSLLVLPQVHGDVSLSAMPQSLTERTSEPSVPPGLAAGWLMHAKWASPCPAA